MRGMRTAVAPRSSCFQLQTCGLLKEFSRFVHTLQMSLEPDDVVWVVVQKRGRNHRNLQGYCFHILAQFNHSSFVAS
eukprot:797983-Amphidinium_carterae.1